MYFGKEKIERALIKKYIKEVVRERASYLSNIQRSRENEKLATK